MLTFGGCILTVCCPVPRPYLYPRPTWSPHYVLLGIATSIRENYFQTTGWQCSSLHYHPYAE